MVGDRIFRPGFSLTHQNCLFHSWLVALHEGEVVALDQTLSDFHFALGGPLKGGFGLRETVKELIAGGKIYICEWKVRIERDRLLSFFDRLFVFAEEKG